MKLEEELIKKEKAQEIAINLLKNNVDINVIEIQPI